MAQAGSCPLDENFSIRGHVYGSTHAVAKLVPVSTDLCGIWQDFLISEQQCTSGPRREPKRVPNTNKPPHTQASRLNLIRF
jgi:hypothetical protein